MAEVYDLVVVGAGWHGLAAAKVYLELHPEERILVLEAESSCGGTWSADRLYPSLKSNNMLGSYEFPGFPMSTEVYGVKPGEHIPGPIVHRYLTDFAKRTGVFTRTQFNTKVESVAATEKDRWAIETVSTKTQESQRIVSKKLILATGLTSQPNLPQYPGAETFDAPLFHAKDFCRNGSTVKTAQNVVIVGGAKSAYDVAYAYAEAGAQVHLVIRPNGNGPVWMAPPWVMGGGKQLEKLLLVRWMTWFSPCPFGGADGWQWVRNFLHGTPVGRFITSQFWALLEGDVLGLIKYEQSPELSKLKPWNPVFWTASGLSILNFNEDLFAMVSAGKIKVHIANVDHLTSHAVHLTTGETLPADVLICATGWRKDSPIKYTLDASSAGLGLPHSPREQSQLASSADATLLNLYPSLRNQPTLTFTPKADPYRLYRFIVPPTTLSTRTLAFAGMYSSTVTPTAATAQALWISAYFDGALIHAPAALSTVTPEIMLHTQWGKWRYPCGYGATLPDMAFEGLPYIDFLLRDLGLTVNRKKGWWRDITEPYGPPDFADIVDEWRAKSRAS